MTVLVFLLSIIGVIIAMPIVGLIVMIVEAVLGAMIEEMPVWLGLIFVAVIILGVAAMITAKVMS